MKLLWGTESPDMVPLARTLANDTNFAFSWLKTAWKKQFIRKVCMCACVCVCRERDA